MPTLQFKGKTFVQNHHLAVKYHQLVPRKDLSVLVPPSGGGGGISLHDNLIIQGDNLKALKALLPTYSGKVKCIYIDPPYNTGNEGWAYNDNVNSPMIKEWLGKVVDKEDMTKHDKWLCMMMPRLKLLKELLSEDGVIFISCDDNEQHNLRCILDDIFGSENFVSNLIWQKKYSTKSDSKNFSTSHDFVIVYAQKIENLVISGLFRTDKQKEIYKNPDNDERGDWTSDNLLRTEERDYAIFEITGPNKQKYLPPKGSSWRFNKEKIKELIADNRIWFGEDGNSRPRLKRFLSEVREQIPAQTIWGFDEVGHSDSAKKDLGEIFNDDSTLFATPKPVRLLRRIIQIATNESDTILDSFSGSGTTAQAVLELNKEDGGNRKFILVEQEDYANTITAERVRRVIKGVKTAKNENLKNGLGGSFSYFELGPTIEMESILQGKNLPSYEEFARYIFYTATGEEFNEKKINEKTGFIGETKNYELYMFYKPDIEWLKRNALTLDGVKAMPKFKGKQRLVFAPAKYVDDETCRDNRIDFCQLPYEIYRLNR